MRAFFRLPWERRADPVNPLYDTSPGTLVSLAGTTATASIDIEIDTRWRGPRWRRIRHVPGIDLVQPGEIFDVRVEDRDLGAPGSRRSRFEGGELVWAPWSGVHLTKLYGAPAGASGSTLHLQNVGNGGTAVPAPQVQRHVIVSASMDITDDESWPDSDEHAHAERRDERWVDSWDPQGVMQLVGKAGGEVRVELTVTASVRPDGSIRADVEAKLYEGTSEESIDLDGIRSVNQVVPAGQIVQVPVRVNNDDEGGDFADISLVIRNSDT